MNKFGSRWAATALVIVVGAVLLAFYGTTRKPQELLLLQNAVKQLLTCTGPGCGANDVASGPEWYRDVQTVPLDAKKLEAGSITWTQAAADVIVGEIVRVQFPENCSSTKWLAIQQLSDDVLYEYQNFLALLVFGASLGYTVVPIHDSPMLPYATCRDKSLHCYFQPFTKCSLYNEPERLVRFGDAFYEYTHGRDFLHRDMGKVVRGDWGDQLLTLIPYGPHYPNEQPYKHEWLSALWERLAATGDVTVVGGGQASPEHIEAMVFSVVSDWMFKPVGRIEDQAAAILAQQGGTKYPVLGLEMRTGYGGGPERFGDLGQVDVLAYDGKKMGRLIKDLRWAFKTGADNAGHSWNSSFVITDSDFFLEELIEKSDTLGVAAASNILYDQLAADKSDVVVRRGLRGRGTPLGGFGKQRRLRQKLGGGLPGGDESRRELWSSSSRPGNGAVSGVSDAGVGQRDKVNRSGLSTLYNRVSEAFSGTHCGSLSSNDSVTCRSLVRLCRVLSSLGHQLIDRVQGPKKGLGLITAIEMATPFDHARLRSFPASRRKLSQVDAVDSKPPVETSDSPLQKAGASKELETGDLFGRPESGQDWSGPEARRHAEDRALANALILSRLSDYAIISSRSNVGRLAAQVISARKRVTQTGPLGPVVHSTTGGGLVNPLGASAGPGLPGGTLRWSNTVEKLVYEELDRTQFPEDCENARWLMTRPHNQGVALNFHSYQMALLLAVSLGRTLVVDSSEAPQQPSDSGACVLETLETLFEPLSGCKYDAPSVGDSEVTLTWQGAMVTSAEAAQKRVVRLETVVPTPSGFVDRGESWVEPTWWEAFLENLIVAGNLRLEGGGDVHGAPFLDLHFMLWSITTQWMWRPQARVREITDAIKCAWPDRREPTVAVHVRRTDRGWGDGFFREHHRFRDLGDYGRAVEKLEADWGIHWPSVFLFTDTASVLRQAAANATDLGFTDSERQVMYNPLVELDPITVHQSHLNVPCPQRNQIMQHYVAELTLAAEEADYAVFAGSASGARIVWEIMAAHRQFGQTKADGDLVHSLDTGWYYEW
ncbi:hypothetical protein KFL_000270070 [Klebsormidium nitens]|uniref:Uncharacterized protein n=1 Tax=Klebsormidium nitens TaxID=105231 RepID=A0A1Y1HTT3_KLENI|nr:hypothetical protein KFL_000270070 [Klebsormidium nitens]|eukprot:GAQ79248.1 hypothetical protein KFL_000270070 [Klebsormidium nitens]